LNRRTEMSDTINHINYIPISVVIILIQPIEFIRKAFSFMNIKIYVMKDSKYKKKFFAYQGKLLSIFLY